MPSRDFYVYLHRRLSDNKTFYVGKGCGNRAFSEKSRSKKWIDYAKNHGYRVEIIQSGMQEWWAFELEKELIAFYGRENLVNMTDGGDGASGHRHSDEYKLMLKERMILRHSNREEWERTKTIKIKKGLSEELKIKRDVLLRTVNIGRKHTEATAMFNYKGETGRYVAGKWEAENV